MVCSAVIPKVFEKEKSAYWFFMQLQIRVYSGVSSMADNNRLFERIVEVHDDLSIPFESLVKDMKFLFGSSCIVSFNVM